MFRRIMVVVLATAGLLIAGSAQAGAAQVGCGDKITKDTKLTKDLKNCPDNGIVIGADNITLDLNGHTLDGDNKLADPCKKFFCDMGILDRGHHGVTIKGGDITQFGFGMFFLNDKRSRIQGIRSFRNHFNGLALISSKYDRVTGTRTNANGLEVDFPGIAVIDSKRVRIRNATSARNADLGLFAEGTDRSRFVGNTLLHNSEAGALVEGNQNVIRGNRVLGNGDGLDVTGNQNRITRNLADARGCGRHCGVGIALDSGRNNVIAANKVRDTRVVGIRLKTFVKSQALADNVVRRNHVHSSRGRGITVAGSGRRTLLRANHVTRAKAAGIHVGSASATLAANHANRNGALGIAARRGVLDGGGNIAHGNGDPRECNHVACS